MTIADTLPDLIEAGEDFEWYPTTPRMIDAAMRCMPDTAGHIMDIGAGDGRVLARIAQKCTRATLYSIELSPVLMQLQPDNVVPVGTNVYEQNLSCLPMDYIFCNPPYSEYEQWACKIIAEGFALSAFLVVPQRWKESLQIAAALERRGARTRVLHTDDFLDGERKARAIVDVVQITFPKDGHYYDKPVDPFDIWFDNNIDTFDHIEPEEDKYDTRGELARRYANANIGEMVEAYQEEYQRMQDNYRAIFKLDHAILAELGVKKEAVREGIKTKMAGLKNKYWHLLFNRLDVLTSRLSTKTKEKFLEKLTANTAVDFSASNAYAVALWAIKNANKYYDEQLLQLFRDLSTFEGVHNYKSNRRTWEKSGWRYTSTEHSHYALDYRFVVEGHYGIRPADGWTYDYTNNLSRGCHEQIADVIAVMSNLGFAVMRGDSSLNRQWEAGQWQDFYPEHGDDMLFQVKAHKNGNLHYRFMPDAIKRLNVEAGRLLGWLHNTDDVVSELGYSQQEAAQYFGANAQITAANVPLLTTGKDGET